MGTKELSNPPSMARSIAPAPKINTGINSGMDSRASKTEPFLLFIVIDDVKAPRRLNNIVTRQITPNIIIEISKSTWSIIARRGDISATGRPVKIQCVKILAAITAENGTGHKIIASNVPSLISFVNRRSIAVNEENRALTINIPGAISESIFVSGPMERGYIITVKIKNNGIINIWDLFLMSDFISLDIMDNTGLIIF